MIAINIPYLSERFHLRLYVRSSVPSTIATSGFKKRNELMSRARESGVASLNSV